MLTSYAKAQDYDLILQDALWVGKSVDITDDVIKALNGATSSAGAGGDLACGGRVHRALAPGDVESGAVRGASPGARTAARRPAMRRPGPARKDSAAAAPVERIGGSL